ncbi:MAG: hypothetical protein RL129_105 [Actinomycetota bacterium]|jgi:D-sedoheptulose 7-phosphate isomerase
MNFIEAYMNEVREIADKIDKSRISELVIALKNLQESKGRLFILGVGGSAGNSGHAVNDFRKLAGIEAYAPTDNISELTARTNDEGWETAFTGYLQASNFTSNDCILVLSVGGGDMERKISVNICNAIDYAKNKNARIFGIVGRKGGYTDQHADICLVIPMVNPENITPHSESFQAIIWHLLVMHPEINKKSTKW